MRELERPYWVILESDDEPFPAHDFNREIVRPGLLPDFPEGAVGIRIDWNFWPVAALPYEEYKDVPIRKIVNEFWPQIDRPRYGPDVVFDPELGDKIMKPQEILDLPISSSEVDVFIIRDYFKALLSTLWREGEGFSGKRPFGNSGWEYDVYVALIKGGVIEGVLDEDGFVEECDTVTADQIIQDAISAL